MTDAVLSEAEARAERRRTRTRAEHWQELAQYAWRQAQAADNPQAARRWLERAARFLPHDGMIATALATARLQSGAFEDALALFQAQAERHGTTESWTGLAACAHLLGRREQAQSALAAALQASAPTATIRNLAAAIAPEQGWCALSVDGRLQASHKPPPVVRIDGTPVPLAWSRGQARLPRGWRAADRLDVETALGAALGSPLPLRRFAGVEGVVEAADGAIQGWAWRPADPAVPPSIRIEGPSGALQLAPAQAAASVKPMPPFARPRAFHLSPAELAPLGVPLSVTGPDARHLLGSPLDPGLERRAAADPARAGSTPGSAPGFTPVWADVIGPAPRPGPARPPFDIVIPVYKGAAETLACLRAALHGLPPSSRVIVVDDASPDAALIGQIARIARRRPRVVLIRQPSNRGFPAAANAGIRAAARRDVLLLNSDALLPPAAAARLRASAYGAPDIGTVTPFTNDGTILSYPDPAAANPAPDLPAAIAADAIARQANPADPIDIPVGVGFCLYLRRDCLDQVGLLREDLFAQGYGEENDLCLRARHAGWRNVAAPNIFVAHVGATSFGPARAHLIQRNAAILNRLHPGYDALIARHVAADPLQPARRRMDAIRWAAGRQAEGAVILVTHKGGGGVDRVIADRVRAIAEAGRRPILIRPHRTPAKQPVVRVEHPGGPSFPNLQFAIPGELPALAKLLRPDRPARLELHHLLGHHYALPGLAARLGIELVSVIHDYARYCPRIALVGTQRRYCGEPDLPGCQACIADLGSLLDDDPAIPDLRARSAHELARAARVIAPSADAAVRLGRHFPGVQADIEPWEDDDRLPPLRSPPRAPILRVVVAGAIGGEKGYDVLLACVRDAGARGLPLEFVVVGFTEDDERLMDAGPAFVTGEYQDEHAVALIRAQSAALAFIPSVMPETWCFALSRCWQAGLAAVVLDLGAQAERVRRTGRGWVLPLATPPRAINDALLRLASSEPPLQSARQFAVR